MFRPVATIATIILLINACGPIQTLQSSLQYSKNITGGFGYKFGDILDESMIIERSPAKNFITDGYMVRPIINNKDFEFYSVQICEHTKKIYGVSGFKIYNSKAEAMEKLNAARPIIEKKYGTLKKLPEKSNLYAEYIQYGSLQVWLIATPGNLNPPAWGFSILYQSHDHVKKCKDHDD